MSLASSSVNSCCSSTLQAESTSANEAPSSRVGFKDMRPARLLRPQDGHLTKRATHPKESRPRVAEELKPLLQTWVLRVSFKPLVAFSTIFEVRSSSCEYLYMPACSESS